MKSINEINSRRGTLGLIVFLVLGALLRGLRLLRLSDLQNEEYANIWYVVLSHWSEFGKYHALNDNPSFAPGFYALWKLMAFFGPEMLPLHLVIPFVSAAIAFFLFGYWSLRQFSALPAMFATGLFAFSYTAISMTVCAKQYATDMAFTVLLLFAVWLFEKGRLSLVLLITLGVFAMWVSYPALFVLAGVSGSFLVAKRFNSFFQCSTIWALSFSVLYFVFLKNQTNALGAQILWNAHFVPLNTEVVPWALSHFLDFIDPTSGLPAETIVLPFFFLGLYELYRRERSFLSVFLICSMTLVCASLLRKYPLHGRVLMFMSPFLYVCVGLGFARALTSRALFRYGTIVVFLGVVVWTYRNLHRHFLTPVDTGVASVIEYLKMHSRDDDVWVLPGSQMPRFAYLGWEKGVTKIQENKGKFKNEIWLYPNSLLLRNYGSYEHWALNIKKHAEVLPVLLEEQKHFPERTWFLVEKDSDLVARVPKSAALLKSTPCCHLYFRGSSTSRRM